MKLLVLTAFAVSAGLALLEPADNLEQLGVEARHAQTPVLIYVTRSDCTFCRRFESEVFNPLLRSGELDRVAVRELMLDRTEPVRDFDGELKSAAQVGARYEADVTPMLLFLDGEGGLLHSAMRGYRQSDFASFYIERAVKRSIARLAERASKNN